MIDVARVAGVSRVTVSRAISHPEMVSPETLALVQAAIAQLGYVPNLNAGSLATRRSRIVGAIVPTLSNAWFAETMDGLGEILEVGGYQLLLGQSRYLASGEEALIDTFIGRQVDGLVLTGVEHGDAVRRKLRAFGKPVVETWDLTDNPIDMVAGFSNEAAGAAVAQHLAQRGYRHLGFLGAQEHRAIKRLAGFRDEVARLGLPTIETELVAPPSSIEDGARMMRALKARTPQLQAVYCSNDTLGVGALLACRQAEWAVPQSMAVVGFSDLAIASASQPALSSVRVQAREMGKQAARMLLARLSENSKVLPTVADLGFSIVARESS
ncbi:LacI family DNA-binding transcriptional regulator [Cupriavidus metallidurans]|uniref:LacI family DNA-binding transcriptional regulator n=1 Tax=Cupriavidus metallidurans TaxID=119219 RepID=UPI001CCDC60E|nr:LacI family DNA-binding transcriptional regulator [Cupriavidus metallidurans]UBM09352.1 LacI family DNA-binding transcriptional regulator [Cupriavidus metallidurans]